MIKLIPCLSVMPHAYDQYNLDFRGFYFCAGLMSYLNLGTNLHFIHFK